ncbi:MAG: pyridoxal 5'-phosphate synthase glutaminase subunit PdxT [Candidatus Dormiibacterota bacterium]
MSRAEIGVLALQGDVREHREVLERCGVEVRGVRLPADLEGLRALVIPGGESTTMSRLIQRFDLLGPLQEAFAGGMAAMTTCAGTILAAREIRDGLPDQVRLGLLDIVVRRNAFGRQHESAEVLLDIPAVGEPPVLVAFIRAPAIEEVGPAVEVLATYRDEPAAVRQGRHLALTFHPEITGDPRLHRMFLKML